MKLNDISFLVQGPSISIDTACSSSLSAVHIMKDLSAHHNQHRGIVTASLLTVDPATIGMLTASAMLAPDGRCKTLDATADGYVRGEASIALGLSRYTGTESPAEHHIYGLVLGSAVNQDGRSSSLTAPNGPSQQEVILLALDSAHIETSEVSMLEMHGTGTALGDPIEVGAALAVLGGRTKEGSTSGQRNMLSLSAVKSHVGHAEPAAGAAGICRAAFAVSSQCSKEILHLTSVNHYIVPALEQVRGVDVHASRQPCGSSGIQTVGISGFAFQGTNAHVLITKNRQVGLFSSFCLA